MKTAVSLPDPLFKEAEAAAKDLGLSRSKLIQTALEDFLERRRDEDVTAEINRNIEKYGDRARMTTRRGSRTAEKCSVAWSGTNETRRDLVGRLGDT